MNENNLNQTPNTEDGYPQSGQPFPQSGHPYPPSGYPQSGYPQSGYPQSGYPQSGMPYPMSRYEPEKKSKTWQIAIISVVAVLIIALATTLIVVLNNRNQMQNGMMEPPPPPMMNVTPGSVLLNGQTVTFDVIQEDGKTYLPVEDFAKAINYDCVIDGKTIKIIAPTEISTLEIDSTKVKLEDQTVGGTTSVAITTAPFKNSDTVYIYARDIALFLKNAYVTYNAQMQVVEINVGMMGGPGGMPPGGMPQQGGMPMQGQQQAATQQNTTTNSNSSVESNTKTEQSTQTVPRGQQPQQGGQPPQGGPGGNPPQN